MKVEFRRLFAALLAICLLIPTFAFAAEVTEDGHVIRNPEILEEYHFPDHWAKNALQFCVGNGIINGVGNGNLAEGHKTTRAQAAAMIVRLLGATCENPDLSGYTDVDPREWYVETLAAAVELGIVNGTSPSTLAPDSYITREQVFTMLSRAFGLYPENPDYFKKFSDWRRCSEYSRNAISAMAERGFVNGYEDRSVRPGDRIIRSEFAQLLYNMFTCICDTPEELPASGNVLYRGNQPLPEGYTLDGNLTIGCGMEDAVKLTGLNISGMLTLQTGSGCTVELSDCTVGTLVVPASIEVTGESQVGKILVSGKDSVISVPSETCTIYADCTLNADYTNLNINPSNITLTLNGAVENGLIQGKNVTVAGTGSIRNLKILTYGADIQVPVENLEENSRDNPENALETVQTLVVWDIVTEDTYLYSSKNLTGKIRKLPAGTKLDHFYYRPADGAANVYTEDGVLGWVDIDCIEIPTGYDIEEPYTTEVMEAFVNQKGYSSSTKYLVWVSLKTQTVNVFKGNKGAWKLERSMPCSSGKNSTPTIRGSFTVQSRDWEWDFGTYKVRYATRFRGGYAFHSRIWNRNFTEMLDPTIGIPASDGCVRMLDEDCKYIFDNMSKGTRVIVH